MRIVIFGHKGQLGTDLMLAAQRHGLDAVGIGSAQCDITDGAAVDRALAAAGPVDVVINAAAYTAVDQAENEQALAFAVNCDGAGHLARTCDHMGIPLIHLSTDYVFSGLQTKPYRPEDAINPGGVYARSKAQGEQAVRRLLGRHIIVRVSWLFGCYGRNFVKTMLRLGKERQILHVVDDQVGAPTYAADLAEALLQVAIRVQQGFNDWGTYHYTNTGAVTWYAFARKIFMLARPYDTLAVRDVISILASHFPAPAPRPHYSVLDCRHFDETFKVPRRPWEEALKEMLDSLYASDQTDTPMDKAR